MNELLQQITNNVVVLVMALLALGLGFFSILYLGRRRQMLHQERMAAMIKGLHYAGVAREVFAKPKNDARDHLLRGLLWLFGAGGFSGAMYAYQATDPMAAAQVEATRTALGGIVPASIGLAHLVFSAVCRRRQNTTAASQRFFYRASGQR